MIYDATYGVVYRPTTGGTFIPHDSLAATVEVKSSLTRDGIRDAFRAAARTKELARSILKVGDAFHGPKPVASTFLFAFSSDLSSDQILDAYVQEFFAVPVGCHLDCVFVLDQCEVALNLVQPRRTSDEAPIPQHLFLGRPVEGGRTDVLFLRPGTTRLSAPVAFELAPGLFRVEAWSTGELTLWAFFAAPHNGASANASVRSMGSLECRVNDGLGRAEYRCMYQCRYGGESATG
jgi:hypothetical protein